jgi:hypothetical protein
VTPKSKPQCGKGWAAGHLLPAAQLLVTGCCDYLPQTTDYIQHTDYRLEDVHALDNLDRPVDMSGVGGSGSGGRGVYSA